MDEKIYQYRKNHPKCVYCEHFKTEVRGYGAYEFHECKAKKKFIDYPNIPRLFCRCYKVKRDE